MHGNSHARKDRIASNLHTPPESSTYPAFTAAAAIDLESPLIKLLGAAYP